MDGLSYRPKDKITILSAIPLLLPLAKSREKKRRNRTRNNDLSSSISYFPFLSVSTEGRQKEARKGECHVI